MQHLSSKFRAEDVADEAKTKDLLQRRAEELDEVSLLRYRLVIMNVTDVMLEIYTQTLITGFSSRG